MRQTGIPEWTWPDWRDAATGTRFEHNRTKRRGTFIRPAKGRHNGAIVRWDHYPFGAPGGVDGEPGHVYFVGIAREATPITEET